MRKYFAKIKKEEEDELDETNFKTFGGLFLRFSTADVIDAMSGRINLPEIKAISLTQSFTVSNSLRLLLISFKLQ
jgi:hypothetical protein